MLMDYYKNKLSKDELNVYNDLVCGFQNNNNRINLSSAPTYKIIEAISYSNPEFYNIDFSDIKYLTSILGTIANIHYIKYDGEQIKKQANLILSRIKQGDTELVVRQLHNYFVKNIKYDGTDIYRNEYHNMAGVFTEGKGVCEGISRAFQYLLNILKIDNTVVAGTYDGGPHMWNVVSVNGANYYIDVTADITLSESYWSKPGYFYYLLSDKEIKKTHIFNEDFLCCTNKDNLFYKNNRMFSNTYELTNYLKSVNYKDKMIYFKYTGIQDENEILKLVSLHWKGGNLINKLYMKHFLDTYYFWR